ncbi:hypothetical protein PR202_gb07975 [Eleusine coracana subsp. coracana]|uniref:Uncharacterized protein n=1 Tax=Eleusine coracana subsp. coracana TaxID=191504 RepID=A0AAV5ECY4_ELECO|nr:hypothetical protein PR202_gb07975 [Eleusine coracana subsp. coracana]
MAKRAAGDGHPGGGYTTAVAGCSPELARTTLRPPIPHREGTGREREVRRFSPTVRSGYNIASLLLSDSVELPIGACHYDTFFNELFNNSSPRLTMTAYNYVVVMKRVAFNFTTMEF